jgi:cyclopropane fatty-acyl-phospholipid synthase-like methyltransferase
MVVPRTAAEMKSLHGATYAAKFDRLPNVERLSRILERVELDHEEDILDLGCGGGHLLQLLAPRVRSCVGVDFSKAFVKAAQERIESNGIANASVECSSIEDYCDSHPSRFDSAFAFDLSEHVYDQDWLRILRSVRASLVPAGRLYLHTPNAGFFVERMKERNFILRQPEQHVAVRSVADNVALIREAGFTRVDVEILPHYNVLKWLHPLSRLPLVGGLFEARILITATR